MATIHILLFLALVLPALLLLCKLLTILSIFRLMSSSPNNSSDTPAPFFLRGSSSVFSQRQMDVFGSLQALEDAHKKVTKETKAERHLVKKMTWRTTKPAVESLEAEKNAVSGRKF